VAMGPRLRGDDSGELVPHSGGHRSSGWSHECALRASSMRYGEIREGPATWQRGPRIWL